MSTIGIDIDGVLFPWADVANEALVERFGIPNPGPHQHWSWLQETLTREQRRWLWTTDGQERVFGQIDRVYLGAVEMVNALLEAGHRVHFVTHRDPRRTATQTAAFLALHFSGHPWAGVHLLQNSTPKHGLVDWDVFIDDRPQTIQEFGLHTYARVFFPARPWNRDVIPTPARLRYEQPAEVLQELGATAGV